MVLPVTSHYNCLVFGGVPLHSVLLIPLVDISEIGIYYLFHFLRCAVSEKNHTRIMYSALQREEGEKWEKSVLFEASQVFLNTIADIFRSRHRRFSYRYTSIRYIINIWQ